MGREFERTVRALLDDLDTTLGLRSAAATAGVGEVTMASVPSAIYYYLSRVIRRYRVLCPRVRVRVMDASGRRGARGGAAGGTDFGIDFLSGRRGDVDFSQVRVHESDSSPPAGATTH